jgi:hypothetical protein
MALGGLVLVGLTLAVPIQVWHHHAEHAGQCQICAVAATILATPCECVPALAIPPAAGPCLRLTAYRPARPAARGLPEARAPPSLLPAA